jgi:hypothetical protein
LIIKASAVQACGTRHAPILAQQRHGDHRLAVDDAIADRFKGAGFGMPQFGRLAGDAEMGLEGFDAFLAVDQRK